MLHLTLLLALQQPAPAPAAQGLGPSPVARIVFIPAEGTGVAGDSVRLRGEAQDAAGKAVPGARIRWAPGSFMLEAAIDTAGLFRAGVAPPLGGGGGGLGRGGRAS